MTVTSQKVPTSYGAPAGPMVVTVNLDAELFWLRVDPSAVDRPKTLSIGEYGITRGTPRMLEIFRSVGIRATWFIPGLIAERYPDVVAAIAADGHEIASRSWDWRPLGELAPDEQRRLIGAGISRLTEVAGRVPVGFRAPYGELTRDTYLALADHGVQWSSSLRSGENPRPIDLGDGSGRTVIEVGTRWELTDLPYFQFNYHPAFPAGQTRIASYQHVLEEWTSDLLATTGCGLPCVFTFSPDVIGKPGRAVIFEQLLTTAVKEHGLSHCTVGELVAGTGSF